MKLLFKSLLLMLLIPTVVMATGDKWKYSKDKTLKKEYTVNADAGLRVDNSYGNLDIVTWNENRTVIEVYIKASGDNEEKVQERLDEITVEFSGSASLVSAKTKFGSNKNSWNWWGKRKKGIAIEVNYKIKLPVTNSVDLTNNYGSVNLNRLQGNAKISCDYGQLILGELMAENNLLNFDYTNNSTIGYMKSGKISADYSSFVLDKTDRLELDADYTKSEIVEVNDLNYNCDYGKIIVGKASNIIGSGDYIPSRLGTISRSVNLNTDYGSIEIDRLSSTVNSVTIKSNYTGIKIGYDNQLSFDFYVKLSYAGFNGEDNLTVTKSDKDYSNKSFEGYHNSNNSGNNININSTYGGVTFKKL